MQLCEAIVASEFSSARLDLPDGSGYYIDHMGTPYFEVSPLVDGTPVLPVLAECWTLEDVLAVLSSEARQSEHWQPIE